MVFGPVDTREWPLYSDRRYLFGPPTNGVEVTSFSGGTMKTLLAFALAVAPLAAQNAPAPKPKRINRAIELIEMGQPVYYTTARGGAGYDEGKRLAATQSDYINYEMEHGALDFTALRNFMRG